MEKGAESLKIILKKVGGVEGWGHYKQLQYKA